MKILRTGAARQFLCRSESCVVTALEAGKRQAFVDDVRAFVRKASQPFVPREQTAQRAAGLE